MVTPTNRLPLAEKIERLATAQWGRARPTVIVGRHPVLDDALTRVELFAPASSPVLITGETGTGKELFARALVLAAAHHKRSFLTVNCAQYCGTELAASELFGHRKGAFTGAVTDHRGIFEEADEGTVFLDEIGDLPLSAQAMLLRTLSEGEVLPVGGNRPKQVDVRVVAATSRELQPMIAEGKFRADLYYRLRQLHVRVPPVRERGDDWRLIADHNLEELRSPHAGRKEFSAAALRTLERHSWPGNVRELRSVVSTGCHIASGGVIDVHHFLETLEAVSRNAQLGNLAAALVQDSCMRMATGELQFWQAVHAPFMDRDLNREQVKDVISEGLRLSRGSYKRMLGVFGIDAKDYLKFMDFLRHHDLKPDAYRNPERRQATQAAAGG